MTDKEKFLLLEIYRLHEALLGVRETILHYANDTGMYQKGHYCEDAKNTLSDIIRVVEGGEWF